MVNKNFKFLEHTADIKFQAYGTSLEKAFENSALAFISSQYKGKVKAVTIKKIKARGKDYESLLYNFLEEVLVLFEKGFITSKVKVKIKDKKLEATLHGDNTNNYKISMDAKAITYNEMFVKEVKKMWVCQVVVDV